MNFYRAKISKCDVHNVGICAANISHAAAILNTRLKDYGFVPGEYTIDFLKRDGRCSWELGDSIIYN